MKGIEKTEREVGGGSGECIEMVLYNRRNGELESSGSTGVGIRLESINGERHVIFRRMGGGQSK